MVKCRKSSEETPRQTTEPPEVDVLGKCTIEAPTSPHLQRHHLNTFCHRRQEPPTSSFQESRTSKFAPGSGSRPASAPRKTAAEKIKLPWCWGDCREGNVKVPLLTLCLTIKAHRLSIISPGSDREAEVKVQTCYLSPSSGSALTIPSVHGLETQNTISPRGFQVMPRLNQRTSRSSSLSMSRHEA